MNLNTSRVQIWLIALAVLTVGVNAVVAMLMGEFAAWNWSQVVWLGSLGVGLAVTATLSNGRREKVIDALLYLFLAAPASMAVIYLVGCSTYGECL